MFQGKMKALTFSYDDGITQDIRLTELFHKYGMKATFNLNSGRFAQEGELIRGGVAVRHLTINAEDVKHVYEGHEVAGHTLHHPNLKFLTEDAEIIREVEEDRLRLSELCGYEVEGMAYPCGGDCYDNRVIRLIRENTGVKYARTTNSTFEFNLPKNLLELNPTVFQFRELNQMFALGEQFLNLKAEQPQLFYIWGHSYELDVLDGWERFEEFLQMMSGKKDICYCTNREALMEKETIYAAKEKDEKDEER